ncbi:MAG: PEGA domain-containing protein [Proteobacteria bacterium]|nr:PEGA domain-containing protein [Pseudomonadota bacterium]
MLDFRPSNASILIDGKTRSGRSPQKLELERGRHTVQVSASGYVPMARTFEIEGGETERVSIQLQREAPRMGKVRVSSTPAGATVRVDGEYKGDTPLTKLKLPAGETIVIELTLDGYKKWRKRVTPAINDVARVTATLEPIVKEKPKPEPPAKPVKVSASDVTKVSGNLPSIRLRNVKLDGNKPATTKPISARLCIDTRGKVTTVTLGKSVPAKMVTTLRRALKAWRYKPYRSSSKAVPACFVSRFRLKIEAL